MSSKSCEAVGRFLFTVTCVLSKGVLLPASASKIGDSGWGRTKTACRLLG